MMKRTLSILIALALLFSCALAEFSTDVDAINRIAQSVVVLEHSSGTSTTAAVIGDNLILSDACVSIDPDEWTVWTETGDSFGIAEIVEEVGSTNVAVCALSGNASLSPIPLASAKSLRRGETVTVLGSPLGQVNTVSTGTVGAVFEDYGTTWIQINSALPGSTSGMLINESGCMVGLVTTVFDGGDSVTRGIYYAVGTDSLPVTISGEAPAPTAAPASEPANEPETNDWLLIDDGKLKIEIKSFEHEEYSNGHSILRMFADVENNTGHLINIGLNNERINGIEADGTGMMDIQPGSRISADSGEKFFFFSTLGGASPEPLKDPQTLSFDVHVYDDNTNEDLYNFSVSIDGPNAPQQDSPAPDPDPAVTPAPTAKPADESTGAWLLHDANGLRVEVTDFVFERYSTGSTYLTMYTTVTNNTGHEINMYIDDASVNGVDVDSNGMLHIPNGATYTEDDDECFFMPLVDGDANAVAQLENPHTVDFRIRVIKSEGYDELMSFPVTISGSDLLNGGGPATVPASTPAPNYPYLCKGDKNDDVRKLQQRLISLGYLSDSADGIYGGNTAQAVYDFRSQNGLTNVSDMYAADSEMQVVLFGSGAKYYSEPDFGLVIPHPSTGQWERLSNDKINFRIQVKNITKTKTIKAFELYMYATDVYGDHIYGEDTVYYETTTKNVGPGKTVYSEYMTMPNRSQIDKIYVAINKIVYSDGTVREDYSPDYSNWTID